jgi:hypothetical protein
MLSLPRDVYGVLSSPLSARYNLQAASREHYSACNHRGVELAPAVLVEEGRISWRSCVLPARRSADWISVDGHLHAAVDVRTMLRACAQVIHYRTESIIRGSDLAVGLMLRMLEALGRATAVDLYLINKTIPVQPLVLPHSLRALTIEYMDREPRPVPALPPGLCELRLHGADLTGMMLPAGLSLLEIFNPAVSYVPHVAAQIRAARRLHTLYLGLPLTHHIELRAIVDSTRGLALRKFGLQQARVLGSTGYGARPLETLATLVGPQLRVLALRGCGLTRLGDVATTGLSELDVAHNPGLVLTGPFPMLKVLDMSWNCPEAPVIKASPRLLTLLVRQALINGATLAALCSHPCLQSLDLSGARLPFSIGLVLTVLAGSRLEWLRMADCRPPLEHQSPGCPPLLTASPLRTLDLQGAVPPELVTLLPMLVNLRHLTLSSCPSKDVRAALERSSVDELLLTRAQSPMPSIPGLTVSFEGPRGDD